MTPSRNFLAALLLPFLLSAPPVFAKKPGAHHQVTKGAVGGAVLGHFAGHHAVAGAVVGGTAGAIKKHHDEKKAARANRQSQPASTR